MPQCAEPHKIADSSRALNRPNPFPSGDPFCEATRYSRNFSNNARNRASSTTAGCLVAVAGAPASFLVRVEFNFPTRCAAVAKFTTFMISKFSLAKSNTSSTSSNLAMI